MSLCVTELECRLYECPDLNLSIKVGWAGAFTLLLVQLGFNWCLTYAPDFCTLFGVCESFFHHGGYHDLFVCSLTG